MPIKPPTCSRTIKRLCHLIDEVTVDSKDNGFEFTNPQRKNYLVGELNKSEDYVILGEKPLSLIYRHKQFNHDLPFSLISCHIDSIYEKHFSDTPQLEDSIGGAGRKAWVSLGKGGALIEPTAKSINDCENDGKTYDVITGTFDNSVCNAILLDCILRGGFPHQVLICFTGDEEYQSRGADESIGILEELKIRNNLQFVCVLDITEEEYDNYPLTVENVFIRNEKWQSSNFPQSIFEEDEIIKKLPVFKDAAPDESWQYDEHDCDCFSFCLPCKVIGDDMHANEGVEIRLDSLFLYQRYLKIWFKKFYCNLE